MVFFVALVILSVVGIAAVFFLLKSEEKEGNLIAPLEKMDPLISKEDTDQEPLNSFESPEEAAPKPGPFTKLLSKTRKKAGGLDVQEKPSSEKKSPQNLIKNVVEKFKSFKSTPNIETVPEVTPLPSLKEYYGNQQPEENQKPSPYIDKAQTGTASMKTNSSPASTGEELSQKDKEKIEQEIQTSEELNELKERYEKLDTMFNEKSSELTKTKDSLEVELKNKKEFNKVKDILEKELKDSKDKTREVEINLTNAQTENQNQKERAERLEEKSSRLEKNILEKEDELKGFTTQTPASDQDVSNVSPLNQEQKSEEGDPPMDTEEDILLKDPYVDQKPPDQELDIKEQNETLEKEAQSDPQETPLGNNQEEIPDKKQFDDNSGIAGSFQLNLSDSNEEDEADKESDNDQFLKLTPDILEIPPDSSESLPSPPEQAPEEGEATKEASSMDDQISETNKELNQTEDTNQDRKE